MRIARLLPILVAAIVVAALQAAPAPEIAHAAFPGVNGKIAFRSATGQITTINPDGTELTPIATGFAPQWSPDGKRIAFSNVGDVFVMDADGTGIVNLTANHAPGSSNPSWSPAGDEIVFLSQAGSDYALYIVGTDGTGLRRLTPTLRVQGRGNWSPDGDLILFSVQLLNADSAGVIVPAGFENSDLFTIHPDGSGLTKITNTPGSAEEEPDWSPDGLKFAFRRAPEASAVQTVEIALASGAVVDVVASGPVGSPDWSPDGTRIAFRSGSDINVMNADGTGSHFLTAGSSPDWQPVMGVINGVEFTQGIQELQSLGELQASLGRSSAFGISPQSFPGANGLIAFVRSGEIWTVNADGTDPQRVSPPEVTGAQFPEWSPDGRKIVFTGLATNSYSTFVMNADGTGLTQITNVGCVSPCLYDAYPSWSPDGAKIILSRNDGSASQVPYDLWVMNADGSNPERITTDAAENFFASWSPDGTKITWMSKRGDPDQPYEIWVANADGSNAQKLTSAAPFSAYAPDWSPDGNKIVYMVVEFGPSNNAVYVMNSDGSNKVRVSGANYVAFPSWSPDGLSIAVTGYEHPAGDVKVMNADGSGLHDVTLGHSPDWQPSPHPLQVEFTQSIQQLQSVSALQSDIAGDGQPPVPIIAGKPAAMRVYFEEVDQTTNFSVDVSGVVNQLRQVTLDPGCTPVQRRRQEPTCRSLDFYFTPPAGNWSVRLLVKDTGGAVVLDEDFSLTSVETDTIVIKPVSVCHAQSGLFSPWSCQSATSLLTLASHLRKVAPTNNVVVLFGGNEVKRRVSDYTSPELWMEQLRFDIENEFTVSDSLSGSLFGEEVYYFGLTDPAAGGYNGIASSIPGRGGLSRATTTALGLPTTPTTVAHEMGHLLGLSHTGTALPSAAAAPGCWGAGGGGANWPFADNKLHATSGSVEVGFDVATRTALPGDTTFEMMSYCAPRWISPHRYLEMLAPTGPLSAAPSLQQAAAPVSASGEFWLASGRIDEGAVQFEPLLKFETEGPTGADAGTFRIEVRDSLEAVLFTRFFTPIHGDPELGPGQELVESLPIFSELLPVQAGAARIAVIDDTEAEIGSLTLGGVAPAVTITQPDSENGLVHLAWSVEDADSTDHTYWVDYSPDGGTTWQNQAMGLAEAALTLDEDALAGSSNAVVRVIASDGVNSGEAVSTPFSVAGKLPNGEITGPSGNAFRLGDLVWLEAAAWDVDDGTLDDGAVTWSSSRDGALGTGASLPVYDLSVGTHTITMTARDSDNNVVTDSITVTVFDGPIVEGEPDVLSGDVDCSGAVNSVDALKLSRQVAGLPVTQTQPCPVIGIGDPLVFGDVNCDGHITAVDTLFVLRFVAGMPVNLPQGCRQVGT